jgi:biotin carboxylase
MDREHVLLLDRSGYGRYRRADGRPFLDPDAFEVSLAMLPDRADGARPGELARVVPVDLSDEGATLRAAAQLHRSRPIDRVVTVAERLVLTAGRLRGALGLPGFSLEQMLVFRDKAVMKRHFRAHGLRTPEFMEIERPTDALPMLKRHGRIVLKPLREMGSSGVYLVDSSAELVRLTASVLDDYGAYEAEEFIDGDLYHVDGVVHEGRPVAAIASRYLDPTDNYARGRPFRSVAVDDGPARDTVLEFSRRVHAAVPWFSGVTHLEVFLDRRGEPVLCEIAGRPGGGGIGATFHHRYGVALTEPALLGQLDRPLPSLVEREPVSRRATGWLMLYPPSSGVLRELRLPHRDWVVAVQRNRADGERLAMPQTFSHAVAVVTVCGPDEATVTARLDELNAATSVEVE